MKVQFQEITFAAGYQVLLVKSYKGNSWGFPKGKIDRDEDKVECCPLLGYRSPAGDIGERRDQRPCARMC